MNIYDNPHVLAPRPGGNIGDYNKSGKFILLLMYLYYFLSLSLQIHKCRPYNPGYV